MTLFDVSNVAEPGAITVARESLQIGNEIAEIMVMYHRRSRSILFNSAEIETVDELQAAVDAMGEQAPVLFAKSLALAEFINAEYPGSLSADDLVTMVPYTVDPGRSPQPIVFDPDAEYPGP